MKRIAEWFAAVGAAAGRSGKRLVAVVAAVAMLGGVAGVSATAMADDRHGGRWECLHDTIADHR